MDPRTNDGGGDGSRPDPVLGSYILSETEPKKAGRDPAARQRKARLLAAGVGAILVLLIIAVVGTRNGHRSGSTSDDLDAIHGAYSSGSIPGTHGTGTIPAWSEPTGTNSPNTSTATKPDAPSTTMSRPATPSTSTPDPPPAVQRGGSVGPVLSGSLVLMPDNGSYTAFDSARPSVPVWHSEPCASYGWPEIWPQVRNGIIPAFCGFDEIRGLDASTGKFVWNHKLRSMPIEFFRASLGAVAIEYDTRLEVLDLATGSTRFNRDDLTPNLTDPIDLDDTTLYLGLGDKTVHAIDLATGTDRWTIPTTVNWIKAAREGIFILTHTGHQLINADPVTGRRRWTSEATGDRLTYGAVIGVTGDHVITQGNKSANLLAFRISDGAIDWSFNDDHKVRLNAVVGDQRVAFTSPENKLQVIDAATGAILIDRQARFWSRPTINEHRLAYTTLDGAGYLEPLP